MKARDGDSRDVKRISNYLIKTHLEPRLKEVKARQIDSPVTPGQVAIAAAAIKEGLWSEKDVKRNFDRMFDRVPK